MVIFWEYIFIFSGVEEREASEGGPQATSQQDSKQI